jgi:carnitine O-acetyltransferase
MAIQAAYYGLYGKSECTYEPAMTKTFLHGRTEAIRSVSDASVSFVKQYYSKTATNAEKLNALRASLKYHTQLTKECSMGLGQDRHLYALECVWDRLYKDKKKPRIFTDSGWKTLNHTVISTSNCGNPALRLFGFGPTVSDGFGIGYIIKEDGIAVSKTRLSYSFSRRMSNVYSSLSLLRNTDRPRGIWILSRPI